MVAFAIGSICLGSGCGESEHRSQVKAPPLPPKHGKPQWRGNKSCSHGNKRCKLRRAERQLLFQITCLANYLFKLQSVTYSSNNFL